MPAGGAALLTGLIYHFGWRARRSCISRLLTVPGLRSTTSCRFAIGCRSFWRCPSRAIAFLLGPVPAAWLIGLGLLLIGICHLPVPFCGARGDAGRLWRRCCCVWRGGWASGPVPAPVWPILGSMFMFRLIVYLYDLRHDPGLASIPRSLSYFFLLPNVCFPLFPVVDFKTFCRQYYDDDRHRIYMVGVQWIFRGVVQLILYRLVYQMLVLDPAAVETIADLGQYLLWPYLLYLRVSGMFHIVIGMLHLFGFNLPETHHSYFLASSFTDFWRRINIYWKDFMMKVFYYPAYFALQEARRDHGRWSSPRSWCSRSPGRCTRTRRSGSRAASSSRGTTCCSGAAGGARRHQRAARVAGRPAAASDGPRAALARHAAVGGGHRRACSARSRCSGRSGAPSR